MLGWVEKGNDEAGKYPLPQEWDEYLSEFEWDLCVQYVDLMLKDYHHIEFEDFTYNV